MLGRDVLSRIMHGGVLLLVMASASTLLTYLIAIPLGMIASVNKGFIDGVLMRGIDVLIALPALLVLLVVLTAAGSSLPVLIVATAIVRIPLVTRVSRTATSAVFASEFVEAAIARGERLWSVLFREVLPNIKEEVFSTVGLSFTAAVLLMASLNFLGVGLQPPSPDWGIMISENRSIFGLNPFSVLAPTLLLALLTITITGTWDAFQKRGSSKQHAKAGRQQGEVTS
ncbi:MAG: ABC transporter permease [Cryobacterium sp.]|nr:ABC transporter permease [Cryobacterium sp.]